MKSIRCVLNVLTKTTLILVLVLVIVISIFVTLYSGDSDIIIYRNGMMYFVLGIQLPLAVVINKTNTNMLSLLDHRIKLNLIEFVIFLLVPLSVIIYLISLQGKTEIYGIFQIIEILIQITFIYFIKNVKRKN